MTVQPSNPKKILVVDDDQCILDICNRNLTREGFEIVTAQNGAQAVDTLRQSDFSVVFTDLTMPGMSGQELLKHVKQNHPSTCVNIFTGAGTVEGAVACMRLGACDYISKPFDLDELTAMAFRCVGHYSHRLETARLKHDITAYEELDKLKSEFVSNVSHELRTPLFSIGGAMDLLLQSVPEITDPTSKKLVEVIQNNLARLRGMVANILNFSRIEKATFIPVFKSMDLAALAQKTIADLDPLFKQRNISAEPVSSSAASALIEADPEHIEQVLINLLGNAIKFTPREGRVGITLADSGDSVELCVWDTGCGIAPEYRDKIFDRFYQIDGSSTRETGGAGIGLSIVKAIVDMHGGTIRVESAPGNGSRMNLTLPRRQAPMSPAE
ncbi:MAG: ATP-binding protein [Elusimicrobiales bacterium]